MKGNNYLPCKVATISNVRWQLPHIICDIYQATLFSSHPTSHERWKLSLMKICIFVSWKVTTIYLEKWHFSVMKSDNYISKSTAHEIWHMTIMPHKIGSYLWYKVTTISHDKWQLSPPPPESGKYFPWNMTIISHEKWQLSFINCNNYLPWRVTTYFASCWRSSKWDGWYQRTVT